MIQKELLELFNISLKKIGIENQEIKLIFPSNISFGDFTTNVAMELAKEVRKNPMVFAEEIVKNIPDNNIIKKINVAKPGYINFFLKEDIIHKQILKILNNDSELFDDIKKQKILIEFGQPNTHKVPHVGHLFSYIYGESLSRIFEYIGYDVKRLNYQGDVGLHVAKCLYVLKENDKSINKLKSLKEKINLLQEAYQKGSELYEKDKNIEKNIDNLNIQIYNKNPKIFKLWEETRKWSLDFYKEFENILGVKYTKNYFESECSEIGKDIVKKNLNRVFEKSQNAIIFKGEKHGLHTRVFINKYGNPTYEGKEIGLNFKKMNDFDFNTSIVTTANEQNEYYKVTTKASEILFPQLKNKLKHLGYGMISLETGKMSSRRGKIVDAINLIEIIKNQIIKEYKTSPSIAQALSIASIKYSFLMSDPFKNIEFNLEKSIAKEGNSAAYILYTYVRTLGILNKTQNKNNFVDLSNLNNEENHIIRFLNLFINIIKSSAFSYKPSFIATYLYELSKMFNLFYQKHRVLKADIKNKDKRIFITSSVGKIIKIGLDLIGIETVDKM